MDYGATGLSDLIDMDVSDRPQPEGDMASAEHRSRRDAPHPPPGKPGPPPGIGVAAPALRVGTRQKA